MSILLQATQPTAPQWASLYALAAAAMAGAAGVGLFNSRKLTGTRMQDHPHFAPLAFPFLAGILGFLIAQIVYGAYMGLKRPPGEPFDESNLTTSDWIFLATAPQLAALAGIVVTHLLLSRKTLLKLGLRVRQLPGGLLRALLGTLIVFPVIFLISALAERLYQRFGYQHPTEHDLLRVLTQASERQEVLLLLAITLIAPVTEELLFRGHLQTLLRRLFGGRPRFERPVLPLPAPSPAFAEAPASPCETLVPQDGALAPWTAWVAILLASGLFALIHPLWSAPPIFLLSVALGYAYERTGNLWVPILMHTMFNGSQTILFLWQDALNGL